jgi:hypothetical protein
VDHTELLLNCISISQWLLLKQNPFVSIALVKTSLLKGRMPNVETYLMRQKCNVQPEEPSAGAFENVSIFLSIQFDYHFCVMDRSSANFI